MGEELRAHLTASLTTSTCTHATAVGARASSPVDFPAWVPQEFKDTLAARDITQLYSHQARTAQLAHEGTDVVVATGTSSGKSLGYLLPIVSMMMTDPHGCALYLTPTKALGSDQLHTIAALLGGPQDPHGVFPAPYDGDTPQSARSHIRDQSRFILSNPDMVHVGIAPNHQRWGRFFRHLRFIVIDECHTYRGVFGSHVSMVLRRLLRIAASYGATPTLVLASATSRNPAEHASILCGREVTAVTEDGAPAGARTILLWEPGMTEDSGAPARRPVGGEAAKMMALTVAAGARTLTFVRSRRQAETVALRTQFELAQAGRQDDAQRVAAYRAGYLAEDRRALERALDDGSLVGVASTNALELGIDVGGLDAVITAGFPGTIASFWQQAGRAGRRGQESLVCFLASDNPLDSYVVHHPEALLDRPIEATVCNPFNPYILADHVYCAAAERPLSDQEIAQLRAEEVAKGLAAQGVLRYRAAKRLWFATPPVGEPGPHEQVSLRGSGAHYSIVDATDGRLLGTIDSARARSQVHPGAVYLHRGESFVVRELYPEDRLALVEPEEPDYTTQANAVTDIRVVEQIAEPVQLRPGVWLAHVAVEVSHRVTGYTVRSFTGEVLEQVPLDLPVEYLQTQAVAYTIDPLVLDELGVTDVPGALHAAEHAAIGLLPLIATCDRWDIGGVSTAAHTDTLLPTVFVYDGYPGGAGLAQEGFHRFQEWMIATAETIRLCPCQDGCPSCVHSPKCGNGNNPLDKEGALAVVDMLSQWAPPGP